MNHLIHMLSCPYIILVSCLCHFLNCPLAKLLQVSQLGFWVLGFDLLIFKKCVLHRNSS